MFKDEYINKKVMISGEGRLVEKMIEWMGRYD